MENILDFSLKDNIKLIDDMSDDEVEKAPASFGFWYSIDEGEASILIDLLKNDETRKKCQEAITILNKLESAINDYVLWI